MFDVIECDIVYGTILSYVFTFFFFRTFYGETILSYIHSFIAGNETLKRNKSPSIFLHFSLMLLSYATAV